MSFKKLISILLSLIITISFMCISPLEMYATTNASVAKYVGTFFDAYLLWFMEGYIWKML